MASGKKWTAHELLILLNIYDKLPFGQFDGSQKVIQDIAARMGRTPGSVAMKLCNLASLDPKLKARGRKGLAGASELDREMWAAYNTRRNELGPQGETAFRNLFEAGENDEVELIKGVGVEVLKDSTGYTGPTEIMAQVATRRGQQLFRQAVLNVFEGQCCVTGIHIREMLIASHIKPWKKFPDDRLNPQNGLALSRLHDVAFDRGLITFDEGYRLVLSKHLKRHLPQAALERNFVDYLGKPMIIPEKSIPPSQEFLAYHRTTIFKN
jgi:putative restriction endonuclease